MINRRRYETNTHLVAGKNRQWRFAAGIVAVVLVLGMVGSTVFTKSGKDDTRRSPETDHQSGRGTPALKPEQKPVKILPAYTFPAGGTTLLPNYRLVALYGTPGIPVLGALGSQSLDQTIERVKQLASQYQPLAKEPILPTLEIITTIASASPTANGDYSSEQPIETIRPWVMAAQARGVYIVLDLQPGRTDFLSQAKQYESLLIEPNVGLALDPEWRLGPGQIPVSHIGSVDAAEVNQTSQWLAHLVETKKLPQKLVLLHQFRNSMITNRTLLDTSSPHLSFVIQMDGQGAPTLKDTTYRTIGADIPSGIRLGWKNFYTKDQPVLDPVQTMQRSPQPWYISYQ